MRPPDELRSERLLLRRPRLHDAEAIFNNYASDAAVTEFLTWPPHANVQQTSELLPVLIDDWETGSSFPWVISLGPDGEAVGMIHARPNGTSVDLGYVLSRRLWGKGIMTEAVKTVAAWCFDEADVWRLWAVADVDNIGSQRVLEKAGLTHEGTLHRWITHPNVSDIPRDVACFARWRAE